ncbi:hypothetical protein MUK42_06716 [Musa troglodytarum]|uniref:Golgi to ER traffic protein 4 homolog n=1 Tax=Musa troglodytarum TaxID=320322 RepID=A0A9E7HUG2_9LILI|nr:hypothetical protein MUK42_06716 [Musa troglodytarum]
MSRSRGRRGELPPSQETIEKLEKMVDACNFYEAQQMYKSLSARYAASEKHAEALDILQSDRVRKMYEGFPNIPIPEHLDDDDDMQKLSEALVAAKVRVEGCLSFLRAAIKWSSEFGAPKTGSPQLHNMLAEYLYSESPEVDMTKVSSHFVRGNDPEKFASVLVNFMGKCYPGEDDMAIARAVMLYLSQGNLRDANNLMDELNKQLEHKQLELPDSDLIQFIKYLLQASGLPDIFGDLLRFQQYDNNINVYQKQLNKKSHMQSSAPPYDVSAGFIAKVVFHSSATNQLAVSFPFFLFSESVHVHFQMDCLFWMRKCPKFERVSPLLAGDKDEPKSLSSVAK